MDCPIIRVVLADSHPTVRQHLRELLAAAEGVKTVAEAGRCGQACDAVRQHRPDVLVLDIFLVGGSGMDVIRCVRLSSADVGILALIPFEDTSVIKAAIEAGANGYALKSDKPAEIIDAVRAVYEANRVLAQIKRGD